MPWPCHSSRFEHVEARATFIYGIIHLVDMRYKGYAGHVLFDADASILHGEVLGIGDVVTFQGDSVAEVEKAFRDSVDDYLAFCMGRGQPPEKPLPVKSRRRAVA